MCAHFPEEAGEAGSSSAGADGGGLPEGEPSALSLRALCLPQTAAVLGNM